MDPIFTLSYSEFSVAQQLSRLFPSSRGYSIYAPLSRQEKGVDLILARRSRGITLSTTIQVKSSRTYARKAPTERSFRYYTWFNTFVAPREADFVFLVAIYPTEDARSSTKHSTWWAPVIMAFSAGEIRKFLRSIKTRAGDPDRMFGFGFNEPTAIRQTRGDQHRRQDDFSQYLLSEKLKQIREFVSSRR